MALRNARAKIGVFLSRTRARFGLLKKIWLFPDVTLAHDLEPPPGANRGNAPTEGGGRERQAQSPKEMQNLKNTTRRRRHAAEGTHTRPEDATHTRAVQKTARLYLTREL